MPVIVTQLNVFRDEIKKRSSILRIKAKFIYDRNNIFPVFLHNERLVSNLIIMDMNNKLSHAGVYTILSEFRKKTSMYLKCLIYL